MGIRDGFKPDFCGHPGAITCADQSENGGLCIPELGLAVADAWHGCGMAAALLALMEAVRSRAPPRVSFRQGLAFLHAPAFL